MRLSHVTLHPSTRWSAVIASCPGQLCKCSAGTPRGLYWVARNGGWRKWVQVNAPDFKKKKKSNESSGQFLPLQQRKAGGPGQGCQSFTPRGHLRSSGQQRVPVASSGQSGLRTERTFPRSPRLGAVGRGLAWLGIPAAPVQPSRRGQPGRGRGRRGRSRGGGSPQPAPAPGSGRRARGQGGADRPSDSPAALGRAAAAPAPGPLGLDDTR